MFKYENIKIDGELTQKKLNSSVTSLIENDNSMVYGFIGPQTWECVWYDVAEEQMSSYGYQKGYAVWMNTKSVDEFVSERKNDLIEYAKLYPKTNTKYISISSDQDQLTAFLKTLVTGQNSYDDKHKYIFCIGELSDATQIRISKEDYNISPPTDDNKWEDFIYRTREVEFYTELILSVLGDQEVEKLNQHLKNYHLSGLVGTGCQFETAESLADNFLDASMENAQGTNRFLSHKYTTSLSGFDYVTDSYTKQYQNGCIKWFRKWKSGLLEHGGIVVVDDVVEEDSLAYGNGYYQVNLKWTYGTSTAQTYDYPTIGVGTFYLRDNQIDDGYGNKYTYEKQSSQVDWDIRYQILLTPMVEDGSYELQQPYYFAQNAYTPHYTIKEVTNMTNSSFRFKYSQNFNRYSYYIRGFVKNG